MRIPLVIALLSILVLASCGSGGSRAAGSGVDVHILNRAELADIYFPYYRNQNNPSLADVNSASGSDMIELFRINTLVANPGYADTLVAMYITGYDPNLFTIQPVGPYVIREDIRYCYKDLILQSDSNYEAYALCETDSGYFGGGFGERDGATTVRFDALQVNAAEFLDGVVDRMQGEENIGAEEGFFQRNGLFENLNVNCQATEGTDSSDGSAGCRFSFGIVNAFFDRASRGSLLLAMHGGDVRACGNGCTLVPAENLPSKYIPGDSERVPGGGAMYVDYGVYLDRARWPQNLNDHDQLFQVTACYLYTTYATPEVCIDPTPALSDGEICRPGVKTLNNPQPAPLRITQIEQRSQGPSVVFVIHVENTQDGRVFHPGSIDFCSPSSPETYAREMRDVAKVIDARVIGSFEALDCGSGTIYMRDGKGQITCTYDLPPQALMDGRAYQTTINIEIGYLYREIQTFQSKIHRI